MDATTGPVASRSTLLAEVFKGQLRTFALITNTLSKDKEISDRWHGFADIADSRHLENSVEREVVDALEKAVRDAYPRLSHRYYKMKAKWFGKEQLNAWDRNAPLPSSDDQRPRRRIRPRGGLGLPAPTSCNSIDS